MATHQIGNFKFKISKNGFQYKVGDGEVKTLFKSNKRAEEDDHARYQGGDDSDYAYEDEQGYYDQPEADENYNDGYYYEDAQRAEGGDDVYYDGEEEPQAGPIMDYIENNAWVVWALLVILPPAGIYLLWRFNRYDIKAPKTKPTIPPDMHRYIASRRKHIHISLFDAPTDIYIPISFFRLSTFVIIAFTTPIAATSKATAATPVMNADIIFITSLTLSAYELIFSTLIELPCSLRFK